MVDCVSRISFIFVPDDIAEGIDSLGELPIENLGSILRIGDCGRVVREGERGSIYADQPVLASDLPMIGLQGRMAFNPGEEPFRSRPIASNTRCFGDRNEILCP